MPATHTYIVPAAAAPAARSNITLSTVHDVMRGAVVALEEVSAALELALPELEQRIERNRARSERARHGHSHSHNGNGNGNGNGGDHYGGVELKLTDHGLLLQCVRCGRPVA